MTGVAFAILFACASVAFAGDNGGLTPVEPKSPNAQRIMDAYWFIVAFTGVVLVGVEAALIAFVVKYRRGRRARTAEGPQIHGSTKLEIGWTVLPVVIVAAIGTFVLYKLPGIKDAPAANAARGDLTVRIEGHQFYWQFTYPNGAIAIDRPFFPAGAVVREDVTAPEDGVLHSWWVPHLGGKTDAIPGTVNHTWFQAPAGRYEYRCAELCGIQHAFMNGYVNVVPRAEFERWVETRAQGTKSGSTALGKEEWTYVCAKCHKLNEEYIGPALSGNRLLADRKGLETLVRNGGKAMPAVGRDWSDAQIDALVGYTKRFAGKGASGGNG